VARPEDNLNFLNVHTVPNNLTQRIEYNSDGTVKYAGHAKKGSATSDTQAWTIQSFTYVSQQVTAIKISYGAWDDRSSLSYD
jgi:hypothetical protein